MYNLLNYFFNFTPPITFKLQWIIWGIIIFIFILSVFLIIYSKTSKNKPLRQVLQNYPDKFLTLNFLLLINLFSRLNNIAVLSMRLITYLLIFGLIWYLYHLFITLFIKKNHIQDHNISNQTKPTIKYHIHKNKKKKTIKK